MELNIHPSDESLPEAVALRRANELFLAAAAKSIDAAKSRMYKRYPEEHRKIEQAEREAIRELRAALDAYRALRPPEVRELPFQVTLEIARQFPAADVPEARRVIAEALAYLSESRGVEDARIPWYLIVLAKGSLDRLKEYATEAKKDHRDIIYWVEQPSSRMTRDQVLEIVTRLRKAGLDIQLPE